VTQDDGRRFNAGAIEVWGRAINGHIYNNTVYLRPASGSAPKALWVFNSGIPSNDVDGLYIRNNIFQTAPGVRTVEVGASQLDRGRNLRFEGNAYWAGGAALDVRWGSTGYSGLTAWRAATGQETLNGSPVGVSADPRLTSAGGGGTISNPDVLTSLGAYRLTSASPLIDAGVNLASLFAVTTGGRDFYGTRLPQRLGFDVGAHELV
jgi:hypothetical protein